MSAEDGGFLAGMIASSRRRACTARAAGVARPRQAAPGGRLIAALRPDPRHHTLAVIAEIKRASPSRGPIAPDLDAAARARAYQDAGAAAISVLTEPTAFGGSLDDLRAVTAAVSIPVLRKDFIVDEAQVQEAAALGATAVLLIAAALPDAALADLLRECRLCGLDALVEVHDERDMRAAGAAGASIVGINNRDLVSLRVDLATTARLAAASPPDVVLVAESGVRAPGDAACLAACGADAVLIGEVLAAAAEAELPGMIASFRDPGTGRRAPAARRDAVRQQPTGRPGATTPPPGAGGEL